MINVVDYFFPPKKIKFFKQLDASRIKFILNLNQSKKLWSSRQSMYNLSQILVNIRITQRERTKKEVPIEAWNRSNKDTLQKSCSFFFFFKFFSSTWGNWTWSNRKNTTKNNPTAKLNLSSQRAMVIAGGVSWRYPFYRHLLCHEVRRRNINYRLYPMDKKKKRKK